MINMQEITASVFTLKKLNLQG